MKKILLTGATGFVGRQILRALDSRHAKVALVVRPEKTSSVDNFGAVSEIHQSDDIFHESEEWWVSACEGVDTIIHCAWYAEPQGYVHSDRNLECLAGSLIMAKGAVKAGVKRVVGVGTCLEYDLARRCLPIETHLNPMSTYAATKAALYFTLKEWLKQNDVDFVWCRLFFLFGENEDDRRLTPYLHDRLSRQLVAKIENGDAIRDFLDVVEAGRRIAEAALGEESGAINICSGIPITIKQYALNIARQYDAEHLLEFSPTDRLKCYNPQRIVGR